MGIIDQRLHCSTGILNIIALHSLIENHICEFLDLEQGFHQYIVFSDSHFVNCFAKYLLEGVVSP